LRNKSIVPPPKTDNQSIYLDLLKSKKIILCYGPSGTGKTMLATLFALGELVSKRCSNIILTRPLVQTGNRIGELPGEILDKLEPYLKPLYNYCEQVYNKQDFRRMLERNVIEVVPYSFMRGRTFENSIIISDETQNATYSEILMLLTRFGRNSKMIVNGDPTQSDLKTNNNDFLNVVNKLHDMKNVGIIEMKRTDIVREPIIQNILDRLEII
jgi:phosphate starvation-inducible PhoH-like protein